MKTIDRLPTFALLGVMLVVAACGGASGHPGERPADLGDTVPVDRLRGAGPDARLESVADHRAVRRTERQRRADDVAVRVARRDDDRADLLHPRGHARQRRPRADLGGSARSRPVSPPRR